MTTLNSVNQLLMRALLGLQFIPKSLSAATSVISAAVHTTGTGLNDATSGGTNTATVDHVYRVKISTAAGTDKYELSTDGGAYGSEVSLTGSAQTLANGVTITFAATTGHTLGDIWTITVPAGVSIPSAIALGNLNVISVGSGAELKIYDGNSSSGTLLYDGLTTDWTAGQLYNLGYALQNAQGLYYVLYASSTYPKIIIGYN